MKPLSIRSKLILLFTGQIILILIIGGVYLDWRLRRVIEDELAAKLEGLAGAIAIQVDTDLLSSLEPGDETTRTYGNISRQIEALVKATGARRVYIFTPALKSIVDTEADVPIGSSYAFLPLSQNEKNQLFSGNSVSSTLFTGSDGRLYMTGYAPIQSNSRIIAALALEGSAETLEAIRSVRQNLILLGVTVLAGSILLAIFFSERLTTSLARLKNAAAQIGRGDYETSIAVKAKDEIGFLGETMEEMRRAIVHRDARQKAMLAGVAHEIRNPLGGIELFSGLLVSELTDENAKKEARKIQKEVKNLNRIVSDFLDYARPKKPTKESCQIREVFEEAANLLSEDLNGLQMSFQEIGYSQEAQVDRQHLKQIFLNLLKNSAEAMGHSGHIYIDTRLQDQEVHLSFRDSGPGIPPEIREKIFEPFFTQTKGGTGLGLAIVKTLIEENGGQIHIADRQNGAEFHLSLPASSTAGTGVL